MSRVFSEQDMLLSQLPQMAVNPGLCITLWNERTLDGKAELPVLNDLFGIQMALPVYPDLLAYGMILRPHVDNKVFISARHD